MKHFYSMTPRIHYLLNSIKDPGGVPDGKKTRSVLIPMLMSAKLYLFAQTIHATHLGLFHEVSGHYALLLVLQVSFSTHHSPMDIVSMNANWKIREALKLRN
jgi:hypothetical protein